MIESLWDRIIAPVPGNDEGHRKDIETLLKVLKRESDLLGLDVDKHVTVEAPRERGPNKNAERIADNVERYMDLADKLVATGGIGGVHRGAEETFDISADLVELARTRVAVLATVLGLCSAWMPAIRKQSISS